LERLPEQTVGLLTLIAIAGGTAHIGVLSRVTGLEGDAVLDGCEPALVPGLLVEDPSEVDAFTLSHDLVRQTLDEAVSSARRVRLHAKVAAALLGPGELTPQRVVDVAHHLSSAEPVVGSCRRHPLPHLGLRGRRVPLRERSRGA
jgi:hypothetical protein